MISRLETGFFVWDFWAWTVVFLFLLALLLLILRAGEKKFGGCYIAGGGRDQAAGESLFSFADAVMVKLRYLCVSPWLYFRGGGLLLILALLALFLFTVFVPAVRA